MLALLLREKNRIRLSAETVRRGLVICDNAWFHDCRAMREYLATWGHRIQLRFLPKRAPETNPIERVWWRLHETITRNHRCTGIEELLGQVFDWAEHQPGFLGTIRDTYAKAA
jgi:putative transposase